MTSIVRPGGRVRPLRQILLVAACCSAGCVDRPPLGLDPSQDGSVPVERLIAQSWVGTYDGWGVLAEEGDPMDVSDLVLRITFDAADIRLADCPECLTISFEPWFSRGNFPFRQGASAFLSYVEDGIQKSMTIQRFSGGGVIANSLLVKLRHELPGPAGTTTLVDADLEFRQR